MKILIIDNYDSFTYNLFQQIARVSATLPKVATHDGITLDEIDRFGPDLIVLSPGPGRPEHPEDFGICAEILRSARYPVVGVCLGCQGLAWVHGARVVHAPEVRHGRISTVTHQNDPVFAGVPRAFEVVRYHSLAVAEPLPESLQVLARSEDGVIMALRHRSLPQWGIQFHPESIATQYGDRLWANLFQALNLPVASPKAHGSTQPRPKGPVKPPLFRCSPWIDPEQVFVGMYATQAFHFWLDSNGTHGENGRFSWMGGNLDDPNHEWVRYWCDGQRVEHYQHGQWTRKNQPWFDFLADHLATFACDPGPLPFPFAGGWVGYQGYELKAETGGKRVHTSPYPDAAMIWTRRFLVFDHEARHLYLVDSSGGQPEAESWFEVMNERLAKLPPLPQPADPPQRERYRVKDGPAKYQAQINRCLSEIHEGNSYEVCLTTQVEAATTEDPLAIYRRLRRLNPAPYAACLRFEDLWVLSSSPEQFLRIHPNGSVSTKPIKGTRARHPNPELDSQAALDLATSIKDRAENLMIADLLRNDLGKVCEIGSVGVPHLMKVESFARVHQLVTEVTGQLRPDASLVSCLKAVFPGGSMTGAPKLRTLDIIDALESGPRGIYSGMLGYLGFNGAAEQSIVIRTMVIQDGLVRIGTGGAIVALSDPAAEIAEIQLKVAVLLEALGAAPIES